MYCTILEEDNARKKLLIELSVDAIEPSHCVKELLYSLNRLYVNELANTRSVFRLLSDCYFKMKFYNFSSGIVIKCFTHLCVSVFVFRGSYLHLFLSFNHTLSHSKCSSFYSF
jgi:hypothetical protein